MAGTIDYSRLRAAAHAVGAQTQDREAEDAAGTRIPAALFEIGDNRWLVADSDPIVVIRYRLTLDVERIDALARDRATLRDTVTVAQAEMMSSPPATCGIEGRTDDPRLPAVAVAEEAVWFGVDDQSTHQRFYDAMVRTMLVARKAAHIFGTATPPAQIQAAPADEFDPMVH